MKRRGGFLLAVVLIAALIFPAFVGAEEPGLFDGLSPSEHNIFTIEQDKELNQQILPEITNPVLESYLQGLVDKLVEHVPAYAKKFEYRPIIILALEKGLRSLPGGAVIVPIVDLAEISSEDRLVASIAHEIAHSALRHGTAMATLEKEGVDEKDIIMLWVKKEAEADLFGARLLMAAGYSPRDTIKFFDDLVIEGKPHDERHPAHAARAQMYRAEMTRLSGKFPERQRTPAGELQKIRNLAGKIIMENVFIVPRAPGVR
jgi:predicted Zn-dependent protease